MNTQSTIRSLLWSAVLAFSLSSPACAQNEHVYFGGLHSHTSYSDGSGYPDEAFAHARDVAHCDFWAVTEHNHNVDMHPKEPRQGLPPIGGDHALYGHPGQVPAPGEPHPSLIAAANAATQNGHFVAIYGQEFSSISAGNHVCVLDVPEVIPAANGAFKDLAAWLRDPSHFDSTGKVAIVQFNHPASVYRAQHIEYGMDDFGTENDWVREMSKLARTIEILNGPGTIDIPHHELPSAAEGDFEYYLSRGFHLAPTADQDNHHRTWGDFTTARTAVVANELTRAALLNAIRARHVYATTDPNLRVIARINGHLAGDITEPPAVGSMLHIEVKVSDDDEPNASYRIEVLSGISGDLKAPKRLDVMLGEKDGTFTNEEVPFEGPGQYVFLKLHQTDEDGVDDRVWTAPVWLEHVAGGGETAVTAEPVFIASKRSGVYHTNPNCPGCKAIKPENRVTGEEAKHGRVPHNCPSPE